MFAQINQYSNVMKEEIKNYFKTDRSHASGAALVIKHSNRLALKKQVNIHPESEYMTGVIHEELRDLAGISPMDMKDILSAPIEKKISISPAKEVPEIEQEVPVIKNASKKPVATKSAAVKKVSRKK